MTVVRVALAQLNPLVGDLDGNVAKMSDAYARAAAAGCDVVAFPELSITGYPPEDLVLKPGFVAANARVLAEFGDDHDRYADAKARKNYAGTSPITRASGTRRVVLARYARNKHLADAAHQWAFCALTASPGARAYYDSIRARGVGHHAALRQLANRLVGILHGCLKHRTLYDESTAWPQLNACAA